MKITGGAKLIRQLDQLPDAARKHIKDALEKSGAEGVKVARTLVPRDSGALAETIRYETHAGGMVVEIIAGGPSKKTAIQANTVEGGRKPEAEAGAMAAQPFIGPTRSYLAKKQKARIARAIRQAAKEVTG